jgi:hypothetical protein
VSEVFPGLTATNRALEGKTYLDPDDGAFYTVCLVRTIKKTALLVADIFPVIKPLFKDLALIHVADVIRMIATTPPVSRLTAAITTMLCSFTNRFETLFDNDDTANDEDKNVYVTPMLAIYGVGVARNQRYPTRSSRTARYSALY